MNSVTESPLFLEISRRFDAPPERVFDAWLGKEWGECFGDAQLRDGYGGGWNGPNGSFEKLDAVLARESGSAASKASTSG